MNGAQILRHLRWALLALLIMAAIGASVMYLSRLKLADAQQRQRDAQAARADAQGKLSRARAEEQTMRERVVRFRALEARGLVGAERRLDWVEGIREIRAARRLFDLQYEISPQSPLGGPSEPIMRSAMRLNLQLLHEDDLLDLIADLRARSPALVRVRSCIVDRLAPPPAPKAGATPQLKAECEFDWITIAMPRKPAGAQP